ncbi:MAG: adenylosuccinate synthetase [Candidatus Zixiibacteriota bacterium]
MYETLPGWNDDTTGLTNFKSLPEKAREYLEYIADDLKVKIALVSTGAKRRDTIFV